MTTTIDLSRLRSEPVANTEYGAKRVTISAKSRAGSAMIFNAGNTTVNPTGNDVFITRRSLQNALNRSVAIDCTEAENGTNVSGNLIFNGSFDIASGMNTRGFCFASMTCEAPGWTDVDGSRIGIVDDALGNNGLDFAACPDHVCAGQDVKGVQEGETYRLTFEAGDKNKTPKPACTEALIEVYWGGELVAVVDPEAGQMNPYSFELIGGAGNGSNRVEFVGQGMADGSSASIDTVMLVHLSGRPGEDGDAGMLDLSASADEVCMESPQPCDQALATIEKAVREDFFAWAPARMTRDGLTEYAAVRRSLMAHEEELLHR